MIYLLRWTMVTNGQARCGIHYSRELSRLARHATRMAADARIHQVELESVQDCTGLSPDMLNKTHFSVVDIPALR